jgi:chitin synthase
MLSNGGLAVAIENINGLETTNLEADELQLHKKQNLYFAIILYSTFVLASVRFIGCLFYFFKRNLFRWCRRN